MKKPKKLPISLDKGGCESFYTGSYEEGFNKAIDLMEKYHIPVVEELKENIEGLKRVNIIHAKEKIEFARENAKLQAIVDNLPTVEELLEIIRYTGAPLGLPLSLSEILTTVIAQRIRGER